ncbi:Serine/threonine-protein kinase CTR1 [Acorus gramineus]|uniref:Serine/threonine-protein kinase CTR1 n=1 Tax=Acorus gramineus TaxID=55184 RepID=A0AAV9AX99_ACOGR|nr:Serine/threonine-protein kinase CTR1 [Acorus gramineus]
MCNKSIERPSSDAATTATVDLMDSPSSSSDDPPRVKFLCSFAGSILPRPLDGKLRYVGGETRIVSVPRGVSYNDLMSRMRELFEGASVLKYQQPDEDLDALVSVVNDDDVTNMMEEYDKLVSSPSDPFTRLRIFLFSDYSPSAAPADDKDRCYVDALNDSPDFRRSSPDVQTEQFFGPAGLNLHHLNIPHHHVDPSWGSPAAPASAAYYSPGQHHHDSPRWVDENLVWLPPGPVVSEKAGFPGNLGHSHNFYESSGGGGSMCEHCEHCRMVFQRGQYGPLPPSEYSHFSSSQCLDCIREREAYFDNHERGWGGAPPHHPMSHHVSGVGRVGEHYMMEGNGGVGYPYEDPRYVNEGFRDQGGPHVHMPMMDECGVRYGNFPPPPYSVENVYQNQSPHGYPFRRRVSPAPMRVSPSYEVPPPGIHMPSNGAGSPRFTRVGVDEQSPWAGQGGMGPSHKIYGYDTPASAEYLHDQSPSNVFSMESTQQRQRIGDFAVPPDDRLVASPASGYSGSPKDGIDKDEVKHVEISNDSSMIKTASPRKQQMGGFDSKGPVSVEEEGSSSKLSGGGHEQEALAIENLSYVSELIASVKKAALEGTEVGEASGAANPDADGLPVQDRKDPSLHELDPMNVQQDPENDSDTDHPIISKIEPTQAEEEARARGLQTIRNDDLEEIRELGSGTYGSVYHGKWKGSDVAIKRIKASCFSGRPSERERLIADFWKEALILSSLHHPNVVSFYGVVRDGPDGSLATVTEFMVNGSLKQFLQKKDRTIDRRKRLIIAMDAAFGMEYLHGKNIVHFDLKCENLLVNMRDPHRPICKIGDLGLSKVKQHTMVSGGVRGTLPWMAPELLSGKSNMVSDKIDVYSFGIVMWELLTGDEPYADMHCASIIGGIVNKTLRPQIPSWCDPEWKSLMESCWSSDPGERPSFAEISRKLRKMSAAINVK